jgi:hypothetical protein
MLAEADNDSKESAGRLCKIQDTISMSTSILKKSTF